MRKDLCDSIKVDNKEIEGIQETKNLMDKTIVNESNWYKILDKEDQDEYKHCHIDLGNKDSCIDE